MTCATACLQAVAHKLTFKLFTAYTSKISDMLAVFCNASFCYYFDKQLNVTLIIPPSIAAIRGLRLSDETLCVSFKFLNLQAVTAILRMTFVKYSIIFPVRVLSDKVI
jgi:hypothetical protein